MTIELPFPNDDTATGPPCSKCGNPMPALPPELAAIAATSSVTLSHDTCPGTTTHPEGRYFEVRVQIVELTEPHTDVDPGSWIGVEELVTFQAGGRWADLDTAMRPLALKLGEKWQLAERQAKIADTPDPGF